MLLRVTVTDWDRNYLREDIANRLLGESLAQNVETPDRPVIYGDFVSYNDLELFMRRVKEFQNEFSCRVSIEVG